MSRRSAIALAAAIVALADITIAWAKPGVIVFPVVAGVAGVGGIGALALAVWPPRGPWSAARRSTASALAVIWLTAAVIAFPITFLYLGAPPQLGSDTGDGARMAVAWLSALGPLLLLLSALMPTRFERRET